MDNSKKHQSVSIAAMKIITISSNISVTSKAQSNITYFVSCSELMVVSSLNKFLAMNIKLLKKLAKKKTLGLLFDDYIWFMFERKEIIVKIGKKQ